MNNTNTTRRFEVVCYHGEIATRVIAVYTGNRERAANKLCAELNASAAEWIKNGRKDAPSYRVLETTHNTF